MTRSRAYACLMLGLILTIIAMALACGGCSTVEATHPSGFTLRHTRFLWETKIGHLEASDGTRKLVIENLSSESQAIKLAEQAIKAIQEVKP